MSLKDEGFFSPTIASWVARNRVENPEWFALADDLRQLSQNLLLAIDPPDDRNSITMLLIFARAVTSYQSSLLLIERGLPADARTIARSFLETTMHYGAATKDSVFYERLLAADRRHKQNIADPLVKMGAEKSGLEPGQIEALEEWLADPDAPKPGKLPIEQLMEGMELGDIYDTYFRGLSGDSAHTTVLSLGRHAVADPDGVMTGTKWGPDLSETENTLMTVCSVMFYLLHWVQQTLGKAIQADEIEAFWTEYKRLVEKANRPAPA